MLNRKKKTIRNAITKHSNISRLYSHSEKNRCFEVRYADAPINVFPPRGCGGDTLGIRPTKITSPENLDRAL